MAYNEDVNVNLNVLTGTMGGITAIMGGMSALTSSFGALGTTAAESFGTLVISTTSLVSIDAGINATTLFLAPLILTVPVNFLLPFMTIFFIIPPIKI